MVPLSALNQYVFCARRAALIHVEGTFRDNQHTLRGDIVHEHSDLAGYEVVKGVTLLRALPVFSERLGLSGKCDIVEVHPVPAQEPDVRRAKSFRPVEFKLGRRRRWHNDDVQLCAQALCLEEMFGVEVQIGAVFHADSKRRREVQFTSELRATTERACEELHRLLTPPPGDTVVRLPSAVFKPACEECSLFDTCLPKATGADGRGARLARELFKT